jgi:hypothetical protein
MSSITRKLADRIAQLRAWFDASSDTPFPELDGEPNESVYEMPPVEPEPYVPSESDWADYREWSESLERQRDYEEAQAIADMYEAREDLDRRLGELAAGQWD